MASPKILLAEWAKQRYDPPPSDWTLRRWARDDQWADGEMLERPFARGWRQYNIEFARARLATIGVQA